jgi:hypothetical protein
MMIEEQRNLKTIKGMNKREKLEQLASLCLKFLENKLMQDGVENVYNIYLTSPIKMGIQNGPNIIDHSFTNFFNYQLELI